MKILIWAVVASGLVARAQKIETRTIDPKSVVRVETAKDHLSVIEVAEPVVMVAVGNQNAFSIERRENKVFVKPIEDDAKTNLFIWTSAGRFAYELVPALGVEDMHFAIDQAPIPQVAKVEPEKDLPPKPAPIPSEMLTKAKPILLEGSHETQGRVEIALRDLYRDGDRLYIRYAVFNHSAKEYQSARPSVARLMGVHSRQSLVPFPDRQVGERLARTIKADGQAVLKVADAQIEAGGQGYGWVAIEEPAHPEISVLRLELAADERGPVEAMLVLQPEHSHEEAANVGRGIQ